MNLTPLQPFLGFIDFIVQPTLTILGDTLDAILPPLDYVRKPMMNIPEDSDDSSSTHHNDKLIYRPWNDILVVNKAKWTEKHDAGEVTLYRIDC